MPHLRRGDRKSNFVKRSDDDSFELLKLPYDYGSIMHYKKSSFTKYHGSSTLVPRHKEAIKVMGQRVGITKGDIAKLNRLYNCTGRYYTGQDLEGKQFLLGHYYKIRVHLPEGDFEKEPNFGEDSRNNNHIKGVKPDSTNIQTIEVEEDMSVKKGSTDTRSQTSAIYVIADEKNQVKEDEIRKNHLLEKVMREIKSLAEYISRYGLDNSTGTRFEQNGININKYKSLLDKFAPHFEVGDLDESLKKNMTNKVVLGKEKEVYDYHSRRKRETAGTKAQRDGQTEITDQQPNENHGSFAPQKILPELLKGVLNTDNDRPIVIQFAIYQPIVYKSSNQSESSNEDSKVRSASKEKRGENRSSDNERRKYETRNSDSNNYDTGRRKETKPLQSFHTEHDFGQEHDDSSSSSNKNTFSDLKGINQKDDRIDVRSFNNRRTDIREQKVEHNRKTDNEYELTTRSTKLREDRYPEHQTEFIPLSEDHEITVSKKEYTVSPHDYHGKELRVSQTDYKIERKVSQNHNVEYSSHTGLLPRSEVLVKTPEFDDFSDEVNPRTSHSHEVREHTIHSSEKAYIQPLKTFDRDNRYESSSLINFSQGKGTKSAYERENNNDFQVKDQNLSYLQSNEERFPQPPPLELKKSQRNYHAFSRVSQERKSEESDTKEYDIAPNFHEPSEDDQGLQTTTSLTPINYGSDYKEDNVHDVEGYHSSPDRDTESNSENNSKVNDEESIVYDSKSSDITSDTQFNTSENVKENTFNKETVKDRCDDSIQNKNKSFEWSKGNSNRDYEPNIVQKPSKTRDDEVLSLNTRIQQFSNRGTETPVYSGKKRARPDIVIDDDFSTELDVGERGKKLGNMNKKTDDTSETGYNKRQDSAVPNSRANIRNKNRRQSNIKSAIIKTKISRMEPEKMEAFFEEEDLISKPQTSKLNLNPRQALPLKTSVNMERKPF